MTNVLDFLVENYIYVAAISGFFIIALIGFLIRGKKKNKNNDIEETTNIVENNVPVKENIVPVSEKVETPIEKVQPISNGFLNETVRPVEENVQKPVVAVQPTHNVWGNETVQTSPEYVKPVEVPTNDQSMLHVEPAIETFQVKLDNEPKVEVNNYVPFNDIPRSGNPYEHNNVEVFKVDENVILDRKKLDEEVDIIDFSNINTFESNEDQPKPQDNNNI